MCLQKLMNIHHCVFNILENNQSVTDGRTESRKDGRTDNVKTVYPTTSKVCGGKIIYNTIFNDLDDLPNKTNWASRVRDLLMSLGFYEVWIFQGVEHNNNFLLQMKQRLIEQQMFIKRLLLSNFNLTQQHLMSLNIFRLLADYECHQIDWP